MITKIQPNIYFGSNFIENVEIQKYNKRRHSYSPMYASFVEIDPKNPNDIKALIDTAKNWRGNVIAADIAQRTQLAASGVLDFNHIYAITEQRQNFDKLSPGRILGLANIENIPGETTELQFLQVKPDAKYKANKRTHKNIGTAIISSLKKIYTKAIKLYSLYSATGFYEKQGFIMSNPKKFQYLWKAKV